MSEPIKGYKIFNSDWTCTPVINVKFQYSCPGIFEMDEKPVLCSKGFHFYKTLDICFAHCHLYPNKKIAEVIALGDVVEDAAVCCTNKIQIVQEISMYDVLNSINTGINNTGAHNNGAFNSGYHNKGDRNTGNYNIGSNNTGNYNFGTGNRGWYNSGNLNTGSHNIGNSNTGDFNKTNFSSGFFCTEEPKVTLFNKPTNLTRSEWERSDAYRLLYINEHECEPMYWVHDNDMKDDEIEVLEYYKYLWSTLNDHGKEIIRSIPNFDAKIFKEITGIDVEND